MTIVKEYDEVRVVKPVEAVLFDFNPSMITIPAGSEGVVVHVYGPVSNPLGYEVEFELEDMGTGALATVEADLVVAVEAPVSGRG